jgi:hypothetical protein
MRKNLFIICFFLFSSTIGFAQDTRPTQFVYGDLSYGFENNIGNTGILIGLGYQRTLNYKFILQADFHHFNSEIINDNWQTSEPNSDLVSDRSVFLSAALGYALIGNEYKFNLTVKGGPTLSYNKFYMQNGGSFKFLNRSDKFEIGLNFGLDLNIPIRKKNFLTFGFLSYSSDIPLQYLVFPIPMVSYKLKL